MWSIYLLLLSSTLLIHGFLQFRSQHVTATGRLYCNDEPVSNVLVKIVDEDGLDPDDLMGQSLSNQYGDFQVSGFTWEISDIEPMLQVFHNCNHTRLFCKRRLSFLIPKEFVTATWTPYKIFDAENLELAPWTEENDGLTCFE